ncbi:MAG: hypothetical protein GXY83_03890 [Rhodopirellula sp.]|nr:hypothetical protein [Rhodopirellula sp.]
MAIEVFSGNTADPTTFTAQVNKIRKRFGIRRVVLVGDRGMITSKRIDDDLREAEGLDSGTRIPVHAGVLCRMAHARQIGRAAIRRS